jgi:putative hemolysin
MNLRTLLPLILAIAGCSTPNEVVRVREGVLRAPTSADASNYCREKGSTARMLGKAPAEAGALFRCE